MSYDAEQARKDVAINPLDLDGGMIEQGSMYAYYGQLFAQAQAKMDRYKNHVELVEAQVDIELRKEYAKTGEKFTEPSIARNVKIDSRYQAAMKGYIQAKEHYETIKQTLEAFKQRSSSLIQLCSNERQEKQGELRINARNQHEMDMADRRRRFMNSEAA